MANQDWVNEYARLVKAAQCDAGVVEAVRCPDRPDEERAAGEPLVGTLYIRSALGDASAKTLNEREMVRRRRKLEGAAWKLLHAYLGRQVN